MTNIKVTRPRPLLTRPRPPEVNKGTWWIKLLSMWTPLLISTVVMFQAQNRETINSTWKVVVTFKIIMTTSVTRLCFTTRQQRPARPRPRPKQIFLVSDQSCPKTDGLRPHHWLWLAEAIVHKM